MIKKELSVREPTFKWHIMFDSGIPVFSATWINTFKKELRA